MNAADTATRPPSILLTDDDPRMLDSLSSLLRLYDYDVDTALGGEVALQKLPSKHYDLLLLDLKMPRVTGHDVMAYMDNNNINTMTIVVSGETSLDDISRALRNGAYDYLKKPYAPEELTATVNNAIRKKRLEDSQQIMQEQLHRSEKLHRFIVNNSPDIIFILDNRGCFSFVNSKIETTLEYSRNALIGKHLTTLMEDEDKEKAKYFVEHVTKAKSTAHTLDVVLKPSHPERNERYFELSLWAIDNSNNLAVNQHYCIYGAAREITERMEAQALMDFQANHDLLTRLSNRSLFKDRLSMALTQCERNNSKLAVMFIDLDRFKVINDSLGHAMGDRLLQSVSQRLLQCIRKGDTLSRFGGDEFTLLLPDINGEESVTHVAEKILERIKEPFALGGHDVFVGASIGIAIFPDSGNSLDSLIKHADIAMYRVKKTGKDGYCLFSEEMNTSSTERLMLEQDMRRGIDNNEFEICYQPQIDTTSKRVCGVEALIRWNHPKLGRLYPAEFIPIAEDSRLIIELDKLTLRCACREMREHHRNGMKEVKLKKVYVN